MFQAFFEKMVEKYESSAELRLQPNRDVIINDPFYADARFVVGDFKDIGFINGK